MQLKSYLQYRLKRVNAHGIHSPFVFTFYNEVICKSGMVDDVAIRGLRQRLAGDHRPIAVKDFGAGSKRAKRPTRTVSSIARTAAISPKFGRLLSRLVDFYRVQYVVELGTSLGIGTAYLANGTDIRQVVSVEGDPTIAGMARENLRSLGTDKATVLTGRFEDQLEKTVQLLPKIDLVYVDGNHRYQSTLDYFHFFTDRVHDDAFIIFDDIYWSDEMKRAWSEICASPKINVSMDLFRMGIVCKRPGQAKEHFVLKF